MENILEDKEQFAQWVAAEKAAGSKPEELFEALGLDDLVPMLKAVLGSNLWTFWDLIQRAPTPLSGIQSVLKQLMGEADDEKGRAKISSINTHEDVIARLKAANKVLVITGAGISVNCGIPDFRSPGGLYDQINEKYSLPHPTMLFEINYLKQNPRPFFDFAKQLFPSEAVVPSPSHYFIAELERQGKLLRHYTQNVDTLELMAGVSRARNIQCHGSFETATCLNCRDKITQTELKKAVEKGIAYCPKCNDGKSFYKPDVIFFGEALPEQFHSLLPLDLKECDFLIVMGSSLKVQPVSSIPATLGSMRPEVPQILINLERVLGEHAWDHVYEGDCDVHVDTIAKALGWTLQSPHSSATKVEGKL